MRSLFALCAATAFTFAPSMAEPVTTTTRTITWGPGGGSRTSVESSDGSSTTITRQQIYKNRHGAEYVTTKEYVPPRAPSAYQPMKGYCPMGGCK